MTDEYEEHRMTVRQVLLGYKQYILIEVDGEDEETGDLLFDIRTNLTQEQAEAVLGWVSGRLTPVVEESGGA